ncbi:MAG: tRNA (adenosine(37)-N6)-threonylcarbamoyltransferase complex ATPase subunit type 1 TsaE [Alphaproteobacteria bacterium]|nr:tRNA (adenosine(37)-N6)-threonylcarbamoyltransferase complex ATPase subunit type 1 TsaE [Alphaproteobacteria bacterium]MBF0374456.1 tRNA (adenosine(37)-N6)-threonylcarbamoyltransferase complex ATPase subunit type 1 TsaE [Alphaproteobacteria bacterium]
MSDILTLDLPDEEATMRLGAALAEAARAGDVIALSGPLGAGKTALARAFIRHLTSPDEEVPSPTFTLVQIYETAKGDIWHLDLYRLADPAETVELGIEEAFREGICLIEWPERLGPLLPGDRLDLRLSLAGEARRAELTGWRGRLGEIAKHV